MPKSLSSKKSKNQPKIFLERNFVPFLNFQVKSELTLGNITLVNLKASMEKMAHISPSELWKESMDSLENISKVLNAIDELTTLMRFLRDLRCDAQSQKIVPDADFLPLVEKYRQKGFDLTFQSNGKLLAGGKEEFKRILELLLSNLIERREITITKTTLEVSDTYLCFCLEGNLELFNSLDGMTRSEAYQHRLKTLSAIRMHLIQKIIEKWEGGISFTKSEIRIVMPVRPWKKILKSNMS